MRQTGRREETQKDWQRKTSTVMITEKIETEGLERKSITGIETKKGK